MAEYCVTSRALARLSVALAMVIAEASAMSKLRRAPMESEIPILEPGVRGDPLQHPFAQLLMRVKTEHEVRPVGVLQGAVRPRLALYTPADSEQGGEDLTRACELPAGHAVVKVRSMSCGGASRCSSRSAMTRSASA